MITTTIAPRRADLDGFARRWWTVPLGFALGLLLGAVVGALARLWMRLIAEDPEFSWAGTLAIVIAFAVFGGGQALSWTARRSGFRRPGSTAARIGAAVLSLLIFGGAGSIMLPTVLAGALAVWRTDWNRVARALAGLVGLPIPVLVVADIVGPFGWSARSLTGVAGFVALYAVVILALEPTVAPVLDGWHMRAAARTALIVAAVGLVVLVAAALRGA